MIDKLGLGLVCIITFSYIIGWTIGYLTGKGYYEDKPSDKYLKILLYNIIFTKDLAPFLF